MYLIAVLCTNTVDARPVDVEIDVVEARALIDQFVDKHGGTAFGFREGPNGWVYDHLAGETKVKGAIVPSGVPFRREDGWIVIGRPE